MVFHLHHLSNHVLKYWFSFYFVHLEYFCNTFLVLKNQEVQKSIYQKKKKIPGTSLVVQWLKLCAPNAEGRGSIPGLRTRSHMPQLRPNTTK